MKHFASASWRFPRKEPRFVPDELIVRACQSNVGERYVIEARQDGRLRGDKDFDSHADALAFAKVEAGWHGARLVDKARG